MGSWSDFERALPGSVVRGGETFLTIDSALEAVDWLEQHGATLLGIDGFRLTPDSTWPSLDHIADYSDAATVDTNSAFDDARTLLATWRDEVNAVVLVVASGDGPA